MAVSVNLRVPIAKAALRDEARSAAHRDCIWVSWSWYAWLRPSTPLRTPIALKGCEHFSLEPPAVPMASLPLCGIDAGHSYRSIGSGKVAGPITQLFRQAPRFVHCDFA